MFRHILLLLLSSLAAISTSAAQVICTPELKEAFAPCECRETFILCWTPPTDLKAVFHRAAPLVDENHVFGSIRISGLGNIEFPDNMIATLKFTSITIENMKSLKWVHPDAFNGTYAVTENLSLMFNALSSTEENHDLFKALSKFNRVGKFDLYGNQLNYIPDDAFYQPMPVLKSLRFSFSTLGYLGARAFANVPNLEIVYLNSCDIRVEEIHEDAFVGIGPNAIVDMQYNPLSELPERIFRPVLENATQLVVGGPGCKFQGCTDFECDERANWICEGESVYRPKLGGYKCKREYGFADIWEYCASLQKNHIIL